MTVPAWVGLVGGFLCLAALVVLLTKRIPRPPDDGPFSL